MWYWEGVYHLLRYTNCCMQFWCRRVSVFPYFIPLPLYIYICVCVCVCLTNKKVSHSRTAEQYIWELVFSSSSVFCSVLCSWQMRLQKYLFLKLLSGFFFFFGKMQVAGIFFLTTKAFFFNPKFQNEEFLLVINSDCSKNLSMVQIQDSCSDTKINDWLS